MHITKRSFSSFFRLPSHYSDPITTPRRRANTSSQSHQQQQQPNFGSDKQESGSHQSTTTTDFRSTYRESASAYMPTRADYVANERGFWAKFRIWIKLFLMGQTHRPWKIDDVLAVFSWVGVGTSFFLLLATTTAVSILLAAANSIRVQELVAERLSKSLSKETGFEITFESAIVPRWREGTIRLKNVSAICTGDTWQSRKAREKRERGLGELLEGEVDLNWTYWDLHVDSVDVTLSLWRWLEGHGIIQECKMNGVRGVVDRRHVKWDPEWVPTRRVPLQGDFEMERFVVEDLLLTILNPGFRPYTMSVFSAELPLFRKQWLLYDMLCADSIIGMFDGCLFSVHRAQDPNVLLARSVAAGGERAEAAAASLIGKRGRPANKMSHLKINGIPIDHLNTGATGPFGWITSGTLDVDFHLLMPQAQAYDDHLLDLIREEIAEMKGVAIDRLEGMLQHHPENTTERSIMMGDVILGGGHHQAQVVAPQAMAAASAVANAAAAVAAKESLSNSGSSGGDVNSSKEREIDFRRRSGVQYVQQNQHSAGLAGMEHVASVGGRYSGGGYATEEARIRARARAANSNKRSGQGQGQDSKEWEPAVRMWCRVGLNDLRASVPLTSPHISYMNNALIRPIVAYMNAHRTRIPLSFETQIPLENFNGAWTFHSAGLVDLIGEEIGRAMTLLVLDERERIRQLKRMSVWSLQSVTKNLMAAVDYARGVKGWEHWAMHFGSPWYI
ncbi:Mitochondrial distribution and morphology protein 31, mitochondrial precursor [Blyttiomyces sp. JEL0837]|nr:Mitochondrial distribution and morphology protein 31, mitochondrial precursor [Blyttiomyces sp. JEL0837]